MTRNEAHRDAIDMNPLRDSLQAAVASLNACCGFPEPASLDLDAVAVERICLAHHLDQVTARLAAVAQRPVLTLVRGGRADAATDDGAPDSDSNG